MLDQFDSCDREKIIHQLVKVQAQVKVTPHVRHGIPKVHCVDSCIKPRIDHCHDQCDDFDHCGCDAHCDFTLTQLICVEIPISFDADVDIKKGILCCGEPHIEPDCGRHSIDDIEPDCRRHSKDDFDHDCRHDFDDAINMNRSPICILMNNKVQF